MELRTFFFDSYAFFEIIEGNKNYNPYRKNVGIITTKMNLMEVHHGLLRTYGKEKADFYYDKLLPFAVEIDDHTIKRANQFKAAMKKQKLSYVDCLGYVIALTRGVSFLTGDRQFERLENVEYVK
ncbi:PIN domain-containing protein [Candidatus Woesearchaeota archaeon]|nr:PIN domain-containing protein [Candidatus Woesearchaeota archaeon]